ncbi:hypothetical protein E5Q_06347 [Mixia osmundae IAM 14324]|uniref:peptidylprolyl isomerase n=1 Tax=Mixia osmundae (strain CBS 9802 / IAM 14324 / JCM 22182 / KY 12970) TaxID=764103 RepID=G7E928_MIXOS|nr:hypothetical protein E5Q_06347 [Mixia osmundae IAM 14324]
MRPPQLPIRRHASGRGGKTKAEGGLEQASLKNRMQRQLLFASLSKAHTRSFSSTASRMGVTVERISPGDGKSYPKAGDNVSMHYVGTLQSNGNKFDSSRDRGTPFQTKIGVGQVIKGWDEGVPQLSLGEKAKLICTPDYAYGARGYPPVIPANSTLIFEVELLKIN